MVCIKNFYLIVGGKTPFIARTKIGHILFSEFFRAISKLTLCLILINYVHLKRKSKFGSFNSINLSELCYHLNITSKAIHVTLIHDDFLMLFNLKVSKCESWKIIFPLTMVIENLFLTIKGKWCMLISLKCRVPT